MLPGLLAFFSCVIVLPTFAQTKLDDYDRMVLERDQKIVVGLRRVDEIIESYRSKNSLFPSLPRLDVGYEGGSLFNDPDYSLSFGIEQEIDLYGKTSDLKNKGLLDIEQTRAELEEARRDLRTVLHTNLNEVAATQLQLTLHDSLVESAQVLLNSAKRRYDEGDISILEYNAFRVDYSGSKITQLRKQSELAALQGEFLSRFGMPPPDNAPDLIATFVILTDSSLLTSKVSDNPEVIIARIKRDKLKFERELTVREFIENPSFGVSFSKSRLQFSNDEIFGNPSIVNGIDYLRKDETELGLRLSFTLPFTVPFLWATPQLASIPFDAEIAAQEAIYEQKYRSILARARGLLASQSLMQSALEIAEQASRTATESYRGYERAYLAGELSYSDFLSNRKALVDALMNEIEIRKDFIQLQIEIEAILNK